MRLAPDVQYRDDPIYLEESRAFMDLVSEASRRERAHIEQIIEDGKAEVSSRERKPVRFRKLREKLGLEYPSLPVDWAAERLLDSRHSPWLTTVSVLVMESGSDFSAAWKRTLWKTEPDLSGLACKLTHYLEDKKPVHGFLVLRVTEADGRRWEVRRDLPMGKDSEAVLSEMLADSLSDAAKMLGRYSELWDIRRRAIERIRQRGSQTT